MPVRRTVSQVAIVAFLALFCTAGCGSPRPNAAPAAQVGKAPATNTQTSVIAPGPVQTAPTTTTLRPTSWMQEPQPLRAALRGAGKDTLTIVIPQPNRDSLTITDSTGHTIFTLGHTAQVSVLDYGSKHPPVILTQADSFGCGTAGCGYSTYTWNSVAGKFTAIAPPGIPAFRYLPAQKQFQTVTLPANVGWFGYIKPSPAGLSVTQMLSPQNLVMQSYSLAVDGSGAARWVLQGTSYGMYYGIYSPGTGPTFSDPGRALDALLQARSLNLPAEGMRLSPPGAAGKALWASLAPLQSWGMTLADVSPSGAPQVTRGNGTATVVATVSGMSSGRQSLNARLQVYRVTATAKPVGNTWQITSVRISPVSLKAASIPAVLKRLLQDPSAVSYLAQHSANPFTINMLGLRWQLSITQGTNHLGWQNLDAESGVIAAAS